MSFPKSKLNTQIRASLLAWKPTKQICAELSTYPLKVAQIASSSGLMKYRITEDERRLIDARRKGVAA